MPLYEFQPSFTVDQTDLTLTSTGSGVHFNKAVTVDLGILDRISGTVSSNAELLANNYVNSISVDILNINGSSEYTNFLTDYKSNIFTFTEYDNINVFGKYTKDFGLRFTLSESSETYTSEFYLYGNLPEFSGIQIQDSTGTTFHSSSESSKTVVNSTGQTGALTSVITFNNDIAYTAFNRVDVYSSSSSSEFASQINPSPVFSHNLTNEPTQSFDINEGSLPSNTPVYLHYVPYANLGSGAAWTVGPYTFEDNPTPTTAFLTTDQSGNFVQDIASVLAVGNSSEVLDFSSNKLVFNVYGSSEDVSRNSVNSFASVILLGTKNKIFGDYDAIVGGTTNVISGDATNPSDFNFIGAGSGNDITGSSYASTIGGYNNDIFSSDYSILGGGYQNLIQDCTAGFIGGGFDNTISAHQSVIAGGVINLITGDGYSFIGGGEGNEIYSIFGSILGGENNIVSGNWSAVLGGESNRIYGSHSFIAGGQSSKVSGDYANGIGRRIQIQDSHDGALVLADGQNRDHNSTIAHSATLDFANGVYINTGNLTVEESITMGGNTVLTGITSTEVIDALGYTPLSAESDDQTLDEVLTQGNTSQSGITVGSSTISGDLDVSGALTVTNDDTGVSDIFSVDGVNGRLFGVTDEVTGTVFSVNDAAGLPIVEVESTSTFDKITIGEYGSDALVISGTNSAIFNVDVDIAGGLDVTGDITMGGETVLTGITSAEIIEALGYTPLSTETDDQTLDDVLTQGNVSTSGITVGSSTISGSGTSTFTIDSTSSFGRELTLSTDGLLPTISANSDLLIKTSNNDTKIKLEGGSNADNIQFITNEVEQVRITTSGVGIGTDGPTEKLDVRGNVFVDGNIETSGNLYINHPSLSSYFTGAFYVNSSNQLQIDYGSRQALRATNVTTRIFGSTTNTYVDAGSFSIDLKAGLGGQLKINNYWGDDDLAFYSHGGDKIMSVHTDASAGSFTVDSNSNVGIGYTSPNYELDVSGSGHFLNNLVVDGDLDVTGDITMAGNTVLTGITSGDITGALGYTPLSSETDDQTLDEVLAQGNTSSRDMQVETVTGFQFEATGEVGLYLTGPYAKIRSDGSIQLQTDDTDVRATFGDNYFYLKNNGANDFFRMVGGDAIIGSNTNPSKKLTVVSDGIGDGLQLETTSGNHYATLTNGNSETFPVGSFNMFWGSSNTFRAGANNNEGFVRGGSSAAGKLSLQCHTQTVATVRDGGIGIFYTDPNYELDVSGSGHFLNNLVVDGDLDVTGDITMAGNTVLTGITSGDVTGALGYTPVSVNDTGDFVTSSETGIFITGYTVTEADVTGHQAALTITESQISDLGSYLTGVSESDVTQHEGALTLTSGQITGALGFSPISSETDSQDLNSVLGYGNSSELGISVGDISGTSLDITTDVTVTGDVQANEFIGDLRGAVSFRAKAGEALSAGEVVYISGIAGNTTVVAKADANDPNKMPAFGVSKETVSANANVQVVNFGSITNLDTSNYSEGDELFVSDIAGQLTGIAPTGEASALQKMAKVTRSHNSAGSITVMGAGRSNAVPNLNEGRLFVGNSSNKAVADDTAYIDIANSRVGIGTTSPAASLHVYSESSTIPVFIGRLPYKTNANSQLRQRGGLIVDVAEGGASMSFGGIGSTSGGYIQAYQTNSTGTSRPLVLNPFGGFVGIGFGYLQSPTEALDVVGNIKASGTVRVNSGNIYGLSTAHSLKLNNDVVLGNGSSGRAIGLEAVEVRMTGNTNVFGWAATSNVNTSNINVGFYPTGTQGELGLGYNNAIGPSGRQSQAGHLKLTNLTASGTVTQGSNVFSTFGNGWNINNSQGYYLRLTSDGVFSNAGRPLGTVSNPWGVVTCADLSASGTVTAGGNVTIAGDLTVNGTTTTINSTTVQVDDKNIELGTVATPTNTTADGGGITLLAGSSESDHKTIKWINSTNAWTFSNKVSTSEITTASGTLTLNPAGGYVFLPSGKKLYGSNIGFGYQSNAVSAIKFLLGPSIDNPDMRIERSSSNLLIQNEVADGDILFKGSDGGSTITALTLDMSAGGNATFAGSVTATSLIKSGGISSEFLKADGSVDSNTYLTSLGTAIVDADFTSNGLMKRTGSGTYTSITDNSSNWDAAYTHVSATNNPHSVTASQVGAYTSSEVNTLLDGKSPTAGSTSLTTVGTIGTGTWQGTVIASAYLDADTAHLSGTQTFSGAKTFSAIATFSGSETNFASGSMLDWANGDARIIEGAHSNNYSLSFQTFDGSSCSTKMHILGNGDIGIGTTTPSAKLEVNGHFAATTKSFIINNPKTGGKLQYGVVESDQHSVFVRGKNDTNVIELPEEWEWLVHEDSVTVQLTSIGQIQQLFIISQDNKKIKIGGLANNGQYNYTVYGTRKDVDPLEKHLK
jgi:hypothetical protein